MDESTRPIVNKAVRQSARMTHRAVFKKRRGETIWATWPSGVMNGFIRLRSVALKMNAKRWSCGVLSAWLLATAHADAQVISWSHGVRASAEVISQTSSSGSRREADELLKRAREAMKEKDFAQAVFYLERAEQMGVRYDGLMSRFGDTPEKVRRDLAKADPNFASRSGKGAAETLPGSPPNFPSGTGPQAQPLNQPVAAGQMVVNPYAQTGGAGQAANPAAAGPQPFNAQAATQAANNALTGLNAELAAKKSQTLQLMASAQAALHRGDVARAEQLASQARSLGLPDEAFGAGEPRPWMLLLQVDRAKRQVASAAPLAAAPAATGAVRQAVVQPGDMKDQAVQTASAEEGATEAPADVTLGEEGLEDPFANSEPTENAASPATPLQAAPSEETEAAEEPASPAPTGDSQDPMGLIQRGETAVKAKDFKTARDLFSQAWKYEQSLDPETRQRLQDNLQMLRVDQSSEEIPAPEMSAAEQEAVKRFSAEISREQVAIERQAKSAPKKAWESLEKLRAKVQDAEIPEDARRQLVRRVERSMEDLENYIDKNRAKIELDESNREVVAEIDRRRRHQVETEEQLAKMVDEFNSLMDQERFSEAVVLAKKARELDPHNTVVESMIWKSRFAERLLVEMSLRERSQLGVEGSLESVAESGIPFDDRKAIEFPEQGNQKYWSDFTDRRRKTLAQGERQATEKELAIQRALRKEVEVNFTDQALSEVLTQLGGLAGISIYLDPQGLAAEGASSDMQVTIRLNEPVQLKSALNLILEQFGLTYLIQDEVLKVTSQSVRRSKKITESYNVADLVIPIPNFVPSYNMGLPSAIREAYNAQGHGQFQGGYNQVPLTVLANNQAGGGSMNGPTLAQMASSEMLPTGLKGAPQPLGMGPGGMGGGAQADFDSLIDLITATIEPDSWDDVGGENSIQQFETNLSLVVSAPNEVHEEIADLLRQLRRLQDLQVTIEVRFITLSDNFFERIGVDFDFDIDDNVTASQIQDDGGPSVTIGLGPDGNPTGDLDLSFTQNSFGSTVPQFGGIGAGEAAQFGFAILSDIEAFFLIEAAQGDQRTNVLQAPKVTLFNGQQASVNDSSQRPFVTSVVPVVGDFAAAQAPIIVVLSEGTSLNVQAVVSNDRRFVRLTLVPFFSKIGDVEEFTFEGRRTSRSGTAVVDPTDDEETVNNDAEEIVEGTTVQLPQFSFTSVSTTVSVPDGGTILLGGIKRLSEGRNERGVPILSKVPYINRLFKNVGIGRTTQSLMMMVTPRIIIQEEEDERMLGTAAGS